jgi:hypothetical protein
MVSLQDEGCGQRKVLGKFAKDLCGRNDGTLFDGERGQRLCELRVALVLANVSGGQELAGGGEFGCKLRAVAAVGAPGLHHSDTKDDRRQSTDKS